MKSILDPAFRYVPSGSTDLKKTFARVRREQAAAQKADEAAKAEAAIVVRQIKKAAT